MDRLCATIFLLYVTKASISNTLQLNVHLEPKYINVCEGESVTITCTFQPAGKYKVKWYYSQRPDLDCCSATDTICEELLISTGNNDTWSTFNFTSIKTTDSGWYFCKVTRDIPVLLQNCSDGILVLVDANITQPSTTDEKTQNPTTEDLPTTCMTTTTPSPTPSTDSPSFDHPWWIWVALAVGCVVLVVSVVAVWILTRKTKDIIYENTKAVESSCWRRNRNQMDICNLPASKKTDTIKPLRKYDTLSSNRNRKP